MKGDFSRGYNPDRKRLRQYRRILLQQGRLLLDSDYNASVDALAEANRLGIAALGCRAGSPDLGFLITPGRLLGVFPPPSAPTVVSGAADVWPDYRRRYLERFPGLYLAAGGGPAEVRVPLRQSFDPDVSQTLVLWMQSDFPASIQINGIAANIAPTSPDDYQPVTLDVSALGAFDAVEVRLGVGDAVRIGLIEQDEPAGGEPAFWAASGAFHLDGLIVDNPTDGAFPEVSFPQDSGFALTSPIGSPTPFDGILLPPNISMGDHLFVYLEVWERHITATEDPGIREEALGSSVDTCTRSKVMGQVKIARVALGASPPQIQAISAQVRSAFTQILSGAGLTLSVSTSEPNPDPCALPELSGYTGSDNRLYRLEVHRGGLLDQVQIKWSRDNGSEVFAARLDAGDNLVFPAGTPLTSGDLVEVLNEVVDLADADLGFVATEGFSPPVRAAGQLVALSAIDTATTSNDIVFRMVDPVDSTNTVALDARYGDTLAAPLKLRRWHGLLDPQRRATDTGTGLSAGPHDIEDGISVVLSDSNAFRVGDWWQYEARSRRENANGDWITAPHGPERRFAPLALFEYQGANQPLLLLSWLDTRFPRLCEIEADDVSFIGDRVGSSSATVQEALEELFDQPILQASCGELIVRPEDDLQTLFNAIPDGGDAKICIHPGSWTLTQTVEVRNKGHLVVSGASHGTRLVSPNRNQILRFIGCSSVTATQFEIEAGPRASAGRGALGTLSFENCTEVTITNVTVINRTRTRRGVSAIRIETSDPNRPAVRARISSSTVRVGMGNSGILLLNAGSADVMGNDIETMADPIDIPTLLADQDFASSIGNVMMDRISIGADVFPPGPPVQTSGADQWGRPFIIFRLPQWANRVVRFSTLSALPFPLLGPSVWRDVLEQNPLPGNSPDVPNGWIAANLRRLKAGLARRMFGLVAPPTIPAPAQPVFAELARRIVNSASVSSGHQGIAIGGNRAVSRPWNSSGNIHTLLGGERTADVHIAGNRVIGFRQGISVALSDSQRLGSNRYLFAHSVRITGNSIDLRVPLFARQRHGILVGHALSVQVGGNRIEVLEPSQPNWAVSLPLTDGIRIWGQYGPYLHVQDNLTVGVWTGVRVNALNRDEPMSPQGGKSWLVAGNGYFGTQGLAENLSM
jgi:hypothetical protein